MSLKEAIKSQVNEAKASDSQLIHEAWRAVWEALIRDRLGLVREQDARDVLLALDDLLELGEIDDKAEAIESLSSEAGRIIQFRIDQLVYEGVEQQRKTAMNSYRSFQNFAQKMEWSLKRWSLAFKTRDPGFGERQWTILDKYKSMFGSEAGREELMLEAESQASLDAIVQREVDQVRKRATVNAPTPELLAQIDEVNMMRPNYRDRALYGERIAGSAEALGIRSREHIITDRQLRIARLRSDDMVDYQGDSPTIMKLISAEARRLKVDDPVFDRRVQSVSDYQHNRPEAEWSVVKKLHDTKYQNFREAAAAEIERLTSDVDRLTDEIVELQDAMTTAKSYAEVETTDVESRDADKEAKPTSDHDEDTFESLGVSATSASRLSMAVMTPGLELVGTPQGLRKFFANGGSLVESLDFSPVGEKKLKKQLGV